MTDFDATCSDLVVGKSYSVETLLKSAPTAAPGTTQSSSWTHGVSSPVATKSAVVTTPAGKINTTNSTTSTTSDKNVTTPIHTQPGKVNSCHKVHWKTKRVVCSQIISYNQITFADLVKDDCSGMWAEVNICVRVIVGSTSTAQPTTTLSLSPTEPINGLETPQPTQPGMVDNCNKFHWIAKEVVCSQNTCFNKISLADFVRLNPSIKDDCSGMQAEVNVCVGDDKSTKYYYNRRERHPDAAANIAGHGDE